LHLLVTKKKKNGKRLGAISNTPKGDEKKKQYLKKRMRIAREG